MKEIRFLKLILEIKYKQPPFNPKGGSLECSESLKWPIKLTQYFRCILGPINPKWPMLFPGVISILVDPKVFNFYQQLLEGIQKIQSG